MLRVEQDLVLAIEPECYRRWLEEARAHAADPSLLAQLRDPEAAAKLTPGRKVVGNIAVINVTGFITQKPNLFSLLFGGTSTEGLANAVLAAMVDASVGAVVLSVDSPGGVVFGVPEAAAVIRAARGGKPLIAVANPFMASAAYYLASQADEVVALPSSITGSIGVLSGHIDESKLLARLGIEVTEIMHGRRKAELSSARPLSDEAKAHIQSRVDYYGEMFESDVAKGRRISVATVRAKFGEGALFTANDAKASGMIDRIATLDEVLAELASGKRHGPQAEADLEELRALAALSGVNLETE